MPDTVIERPLISFGREICGDLDAGLGREWLVTNGLGGYASGTLAGVNTRRYHGLLVAALAPPVGRTVLVGGAVEWAAYGGRRYPLSTHEFVDGTLHPRGFEHLQSFTLEGSLPVWVFAIGDALIERRVWMVAGTNTTCVLYRLIRGGPIELELTPLVTYRDFHTLTSGQGWRPGIEERSDGTVIHAWDGAAPVYLMSDQARFAPGGDWHWRFRHRREAARGLDDHSDLFAPGAFVATLRGEAPVTLWYSTEPQSDLDGVRSLAPERARQVSLLRRAGVEQDEPALQQLVLAADHFIVERGPHRPGGTGKTIIAGYHWFNDWGRDTMIALPGLCLMTGRPDAAAGILRSFGAYVVDGLLPNNFSDRAGADPAYNTVDAALWYVLAVHAYDRTTGNGSLAADLLPALRQIVDAYIRGTRYGIGMDPADGLLRAGEPGVQLTWMDVKIGDRVVTPRIGKPVEVNALWYNALRIAAMLVRRQGGLDAVTYDRLAERVKISFRQRFVPHGGGSLADVVDGPDGDDWTLRPNQIFAVALPAPILEGDEAAAVVDAVGRSLLTTHGLRSLDPDDPAYHGDYTGDPASRDEAYHQGTVWTWLMGAYVEAHYRTHHDRRAVAELLRPFEHHLRDAGLGTISEIFEGHPPHSPDGCIAQAWSVAEILRVWRTYARQAR